MVAVRSRAGKILYYPICVNCHRQGILRQTYCQPQHSLTAQARNIVAVLAKHLDYVGVLTVECFVTSTNQLLINEIAPRVHNSGHWTIEGTSCSQFDNHLRAVSGMALGETDMVNYCEMFNLIGQLPTPIIHANAHWYDYGKSPRPGRKLGHVTISGKDERLRAAIISEIIIST